MAYPAQTRLSQQSPEGGVVLSVTPQVSTNVVQLLPPVTCGHMMRQQVVRSRREGLRLCVAQGPAAFHLCPG